MFWCKYVPQKQMYTIFYIEKAWVIRDLLIFSIAIGNHHINTLPIYTLWYEFSNGFNTKSDFGKFCHKKTGSLEPFLS